MKHTLKCWPEYFAPVKEGKKTFEIRKDDREFKVGDVLELKEFQPCPTCSGTGRYRDHTDMEDCGCSKPHGKYTGEKVTATVTYITNFVQREGYVVMSIVLSE